MADMINVDGSLGLVDPVDDSVASDAIGAIAIQFASEFGSDIKVSTDERTSRLISGGSLAIRREHSGV